MAKLKKKKKKTAPRPKITGAQQTPQKMTIFHQVVQSLDSHEGAEGDDEGVVHPQHLGHQRHQHQEGKTLQGLQHPQQEGEVGAGGLKLPGEECGVVFFLEKVAGVSCRIELPAKKKKSHGINYGKT